MSSKCVGSGNPTQNVQMRHEDQPDSIWHKFSDLAKQLILRNCIGKNETNFNELLGLRPVCRDCNNHIITIFLNLFNAANTATDLVDLRPQLGSLYSESQSQGVLDFFCRVA